MTGTYFTDASTLGALPPALALGIRAALSAQPGGAVTVPVPVDDGDAPVDLVPRLEALEAVSHDAMDLSPIGDELTAMRNAVRRLTRRVISLEKDDEDDEDDDDEDDEDDEDKKRKPKRKKGR